MAGENIKDRVRMAAIRREKIKYVKTDIITLISRR